MDDFNNKKHTTESRAALTENDSYSNNHGYVTYKRRWFLLATLALLNVSNAMIWLTYGPVAYKASSFYETSLDTINFMSVVFMITGIPCGFIATWLIDTFGLRLSVILGSWLNGVGCIIRLLSAVEAFDDAKLALAFTGQTVAALAQPFMLFAPAKLAAIWFAEDQRAVANMLATIANPLGIMIAGIISPILLPATDQMLLMLGIYCIPAVLAILMAFGWICAGAQPPTPPSPSAQDDNQEPFSVGLKSLVKNPPYLLLAWTIGAGIALFSVLTTLLSQILCPWGYNDKFAGVLCVSILIGKFLFLFQGYFKIINLNQLGMW